MSDIDLSAIRARLASFGAHVLAQPRRGCRDPGVPQYLQREFPENAAEWSDPAGRRQFLKLMGASLALAGVTGLHPPAPTRSIVPYVQAARGLVPGKPLFSPRRCRARLRRARACREPPWAARSRSNRTPSTRPAAARAGTRRRRSSTLYDPDRSQSLTYRDEIRSFTDFVQAIGRRAAPHSRRCRGRRLPHPDRHGHVADAGLADRRGAAHLPRGALDPVRAGGRDAVRARRSRAFGQRSSRCTTSRTPTSSCRSTATS